MTVRTTLRLALLALIVTSGGCGRQASFSADVHPLLEARCAACHLPAGVGYAASGFSVASYGSVLKGTRYGAVIVPGDSAASPLLRLLRHETDASIAMPRSRVHGMPSQWLTRRQIQLLAEWIDQGAKDN